MVDSNGTDATTDAQWVWNTSSTSADDVQPIMRYDDVVYDVDIKKFSEKYLDMKISDWQLEYIEGMYPKKYRHKGKSADFLNEDNESDEGFYRSAGMQIMRPRAHGRLNDEIMWAVDEQ